VDTTTIHAIFHCALQWRSHEFDWGLGGYVLTTVFIAISKRVNVPHVNKTVTDFGGI